MQNFPMKMCQRNFLVVFRELPRWLSDKESTHQCRRHEFEPWVRKIPWRRKWQPTPAFLHWKFHGQRNLGATTHGGCKQSDMTEQLGMHPWLGLQASTALGPGLITGRGTKIPQATWSSQRTNKQKRCQK